MSLRNAPTLAKVYPFFFSFFWVTDSFFFFFFFLVEHIFVDKKSRGCVYVKMDSHKSALEVAKKLHGRWFAKKMIAAELLSPAAYSSKFPTA